ncbi:MAG: TetR/AcrR family transcriptional regulator [Erysipelotrichaceae bacterium]|nr:TetR/AcrR family transcriptional regulator [Erysipelotrichaceae bacterium]
MEQRSTRADRSKAALKAAFLELFQLKEPEKITVVELCKKAGLNRSTFYAHYDYMDELIRDVLWESVAGILAGMENQWNLPLENGGVARTVIASYLHRFLNNPTVRRFCTCANNGNYRTLIIRAHVELMLGPVNEPMKYYTAYYHNAGILNFILEWIINGSPIPEETVIEIIHEFSKVMY